MRQLLNDSKVDIKNFFFLAAPGAGYTHWKQTVFYFPDYVTIKRDEVLEGTFNCKVNLENPVCLFRKKLI